jgi:hypothetical protein
MWRTLWTGSRPLTSTGILMLALLALFAAGLAIDPRTITGAPAWLKPAKFAASIAIYSLTLAWIFSLLPGWPRMRRAVGWTTAAVMLIEIAIIAGQALRGTTSHFNVSTPLDTVLVATMGIAILTQTLSSIAVAVALWRTQMPDAALGWALRFGMVLTIAGALTGGLMTRPTADQLDAARAGARMTIAGAHTVGAPDGGPGLPGTGWSTEHGDLRVAHFVGLHAVQALPLAALLLGTLSVGPAARTRLTLVSAFSYAGLFGILLAQALNGEPLAAPGATTVTLLVGWAIGTAIATAAATIRHREAGQAAMGVR